MATTLLSDPHGPDEDRYIDLFTRRWEPERAWGVRDGGRWVATLRSECRQLTVPGTGGATCELHAHALTQVTVAATHRRRGLMSQMLEGSLRDARQRNEAVSILIAAEWPIYGRFGYAPSTLSADYVFRCSRSGATVLGEPGRVRQVERDEFGGYAHAVFAAARRGRAGQIDRPQSWWNGVLGREGLTPSSELPHNWLVHDGDDGPDGLLAWKAVDDFGLIPPLGRIEVWDLASATDAAYRDLWAYLVLEVSDDGGGHAAGRFLLTADGGESHCEPSDRAPDLEISQRALASIYLGGFRLRQLPASQAHELTAGALARADVMFSTPLAPWNATWF